MDVDLHIILGIAAVLILLSAWAIVGLVDIIRQKECNDLEVEQSYTEYNDELDHDEMK